MDSLLPGGKPVYDFSSVDEQWIVTLNRDFLALTARDYTRWEEFRDHLEYSIGALVEEYSPTLFLRIGLRYQNIIRKSNLGLDGVQWSELLNPYIASELASPDLGEAIREAAHVLLIDLGSNQGQVRMQHGLAKDDGNEIFYLIQYLRQLCGGMVKRARANAA